MTKTQAESLIPVFDAAKSIADWLNVRASISVMPEGEEEAEDLLDRHPAGKAEHQFRRGMALWLNGRHGDAAELLSKLSDKEGVADYFAGLNFKEDANFEEAEKHLKKAADKNHRHAQLAMADLEIARGNASEAHDILKALGTSCEDLAEFWYLKGFIEDLFGRVESAIGMYQKALEIDPAQPGAVFRMAYYADLRGNDEEALEYYEKLRFASPVHVNTLINLGIMYEDREEYRRAISCYRAVLDRFPNHERARLYYKDALASLDMYYDEDQIIKQDKFQQLLRTPVTEFELSVRSRNCLARMNIQTLGDLIKKSEQELLSYKNFGETSLQEIKSILAKKNLRLGMQPGEAGMPVIEQPTQAAQEEVLNKSIAELNFSVRVRKVMEKLNINTLGDLVKTKESDLTSLKNFGKTSLAELKKKLAEYNLSLGAD